MSALAFPALTLPATTPGLIEKLIALEGLLIGNEPADLPTDHLIHAGMYARTVTMPPDMVLTGALIKRATTVIVAGSGFVLIGESLAEFDGYHVIPASAGRKQMFVSRSELRITMLFPTSVKTVEEAEAEFTDDCDRLLSRRQDANTIRITGE